MCVLIAARALMELGAGGRGIFSPKKKLTRIRFQKLQLFEEDEFVSIQIGLKMPPNKKKVNPHRIPVKHSLYAETEICLFTKDPSSTYEDRLNNHPVDEVKTVIDVSTLRKDYRQYEDKRGLMALYDFFLADDRIVTLLPPLIGKTFFRRSFGSYALSYKLIKIHIVGGSNQSLSASRARTLVLKLSKPATLPTYLCDQGTA